MALEHATRLLETDASSAREQAEEILRVVPAHPAAVLLHSLALCSLGNSATALTQLEALVAAQPHWARAQFELGRMLAAAGHGERAVAALQCAVTLQPQLPEAWLALADHLHGIGDRPGADAAYAQHIRHSTRDPRLLEAAAALCEGRLAPAEALLRAHLRERPTDVAAIRMFAEVAARLGRYGDAVNLLARALDLAPGFMPARHNYAQALYRSGNAAEALAQVDQLLAQEPRSPSHRNLKAAILGRMGQYDASIALYRGVLDDYPNQAKVWTSYGHALKTAGQQSRSVQAYRRAVELAPHFGEAWWSLANLKTLRFSDSDLEQIRAQLARPELTDEDRFHFDFALGKALEDRGEFAQSFAHYAGANRLRRATIHHDCAQNQDHVRRSRDLFTAEFFATRRGQGVRAGDPIFIVGLPRAGSTLLEQILASHSAVEGTMELPDIIALSRELGGSRSRSQPSAYPEVLAGLSARELHSLGEQYLTRTRVQRKTGKPFFIDKMPNNFQHVGFMNLILPDARIIDARRHPLGCCFSSFKQHFARGQTFSYDLDELGHYYRDYVELMAHFDAVLPGRVHRVIYETMIADTEAEVRRLLDYCGLQFEDACLRFYENDRAVRTASSEQVRKPIFTDAVEQWRNYELWLAPLKLALGPTLDTWSAGQEPPAASKL